MHRTQRYDLDTILMALNAADTHYLRFIRYPLPEAQSRGMGIIGTKVATRGRILSTRTPPLLEQQPSASEPSCRARSR